MIFRPSFLGAIVLFLVAGPAKTQVTDNRNCRDDRGTDRCAGEQQRAVRALYGVRSIEEHRTAGDQVRRIFYVDGYGSDLLLIAFVRAPGSDPIVRVHFPRREGGEAPDSLQAAVPWAVWQDILFRSAHFDRELVPLPPPGGLCMHSWVYTIEATDPARSREEPATQRRAVEDACAQGLARHYAIEVERATLPLFPHCARLASNQHPSPSTQLAACRILRGDRMAAAEVRNLAQALRTIGGAGDAARLTQVLTDLSVINWNGERNEGHGSAAPFWAAHAAPTRGVTNLYFESIEGESASRVRLTGTLTRTTDTSRGGATGTETARVVQIWTGAGGFFRVESATVGPWEPFPPR